MKKLAFVVGVNDYPDEGLDNPVNDANSITEAFNKLGIDTIKKVNVGVADLKDALDDYKQRLSEYEVAIFFFAGHGAEIKGENYLCTVDTDFETETRIQYTSLALSYLINLLEEVNVYTKIIILDSCRDNPFDKRHRSLSAKQLAPVFAPLGTIIAFATSPGQKSDDGKNGNGAYTHSLLQHIFVNDIKIEELFKRTRNTLYSLTAKKQLSWEHTSLMGDFYFSNSMLSGEYNTAYSKESIEDATFNYIDNSTIMNIVIALRSCSWDNQNPAINRFFSIDFPTAKKEELFLLGRNIYQAGIGPAWGASGFLENIHSNLDRLAEEVRFHILNGIVFEIYFNSSGMLREDFKNDKIDLIFNELLNLKNVNSLLFIEGLLRQYEFRFIYINSIHQSLVLNIVVEKFQEDLFRLSEIQYEGKNIIYKYDGTGVYEPNDDVVRYTKERFTLDLLKKIGAPSYKVSIHYIGLPDTEERLCVPYEYKILNYPIKSK
jgi:hypothetical protein